MPAATPKSPSERLRDCGLQVTAQRLAALKAVEANPHSTADILTSAIKEEIGSVSRQAVYDALSTLTAHGLIRRIQPAGSSARYEGRVGDNHHHLVCRSCGLTVDVDCSVGFKPCLEASDSQCFEIDEAEVIYWGRCGGCVGETYGGSQGGKKLDRASLHINSTATT